MITILQSELIELAEQVCRQKAESQTIEVKAAHVDCPRRLYDTLSSFSNQDSGGIVLFGIDEKADFKVVGVYDLQDLQKKVAEQCRNMVPPVRAVFTTAEMDGYPICSAEIPAIDLADRPCYYGGSGRVGGAYIRVGDADMKMTDYELYSFESFRKHQHDDERPVERASLDLLDRNLLQLYVLQRSKDRPQFAQLTQEQAYEMLNITRGGKPTLAAVMNFGAYPQGFFPQLGIIATVVPGTQIGVLDDNSARFLDNKRIEGTIAAMTDDAMAFCRRNMKINTIIDPETGQRTDRTEYPMEAIREAILNALIHRDYSVHTEGTPIQINFFTDRLEIHSPGNLYGRMSIEQLGVARPDLRNPALAVMTENLIGSENRYSGIPTMRRAMKEYGLPEPVFENRRQEFVVTLYNSSQDAGKEYDAESDLLAFCKTPRTRQEIADYLGLTTISHVQKRYIDPLIESGQIMMTIPDKPRSRYQKFYTVRQ